MSRHLTYFAMVLGVVFGSQQAEGQTSSQGASSSSSSEICPRPARKHGCGGCGGVWGYHASTAAEGSLRGMAAVIHAQGDYNLATSEAMVNLAAAEKLRIANHTERIGAYFAGRQMNLAARAIERGPRSAARGVRANVAQAGDGRRAAENSFDRETGKIVWPVLLQSEKYEPFRKEMEQLFAKRMAGAGVDAAQNEQVTEMARGVLTELKERIREYSAEEYLAARRFLTRLIGDAQQAS